MIIWLLVICPQFKKRIRLTSIMMGRTEISGLRNELYNNINGISIFFHKLVGLK
jgi:hypothetical protein